MKNTSVNRRGVNVGDVLLISQRKTPRSMWPIGKVTRLVKSSDNIVRGAVLYSKGVLINRPINLLYPLEIPSRCGPDSDANDVTSDSKPN